MPDRTETAAVAREGTFRRELGLIDAGAIVAGSMIGSGIFIVSADVARTVDSAGWLLLVWILNALMTVLGALAYGELAAMMPRAGGQYVYLREAYSPLLGFLYGWTLFLVIQSGTIAAVAVAFAKFLGVLLPWVSAEHPLARVGSVSLSTQRLVAIAVIALLTWANSRGLREGKIVQNLFTFAKVAALATLITLGLFVARRTEAVTSNFSGLWGDTPVTLGFLMLVGGAMVGPLFSSDAWNNITFTAGEVKNPRRILPLSLLGGTGLVMLLYCLTNVAYLCLLPLAGAATGETVAARGIQYAADDRVAIVSSLTWSAELLPQGVAIGWTVKQGPGFVVDGEREVYPLDVMVGSYVAIGVGRDRAIDVVDPLKIADGRGHDRINWRALHDGVAQDARYEDIARDTGRAP